MSRLHRSSDVCGDGRNAAQPILNYIILWHRSRRGDGPNSSASRSAHFSRRGWYWRSGWVRTTASCRSSAAVTPVRAQAYDAGHFSLYRGQSALAGDSGYGGKNTEDHNGVLFDGKGQQLKCAEGRISAYEPGELATYARGSLGDLYHNEALKSYNRHIYFCHDQHPYAVVMTR